MSTITPPAPPPPADLEALLRRLRMPHTRAAAPDVLATARSQRWEPAEAGPSTPTAQTQFDHQLDAVHRTAAQRAQSPGCHDHGI